MAMAHGAMLNPAPRSSHSHTWDLHNKCGSITPYSKAQTRGVHITGEYCGLGCLGDACLYYQIGCFHSCGNCSLTGKTMYPVPNDLTKAGCKVAQHPSVVRYCVWVSGQAQQ
jgi:hypothetical protein